MNLKKLFLTMSLIAITPTSQALSNKPLKAFLQRAKTNKLVQHSSEGLQIVSLAAVTALLMGAASQNMDWATDSLKKNMPDDTKRFIKLCSSEVLLKGMAAISIYIFSKATVKADKSKDQTQLAEQAA
jgi:hypothetical protein